MALNDPTPINYAGWPKAANVVPSDTTVFPPSVIEVLVGGTFKVKNPGSGEDVVITVTDAMCPYKTSSPMTMFYNTGSDAAYDTLGTVLRHYNP